MPWRVVLLFLFLAPNLAGCAMDRPLLAGDGPVFGANGAVAGFRHRIADVPVQLAHGVSSEPGGVVEETVYEAPAAIAWDEAVVVASEPADGPYLLDTGDRLRVFVYGQPNLSRTYIVDHEGEIAIPLIGSLGARGLTTSALAGHIAARLGRDFVRDPQVTVDVIQNRPFFILGEVRNAGQFPYVSGMTVETAVAIAGGYSERASRRSYRVTRRSGGHSETLEVPSDFAVKPGDTVFVYERFL